MKSSKGSEFEREISKKLSLWFSKGQRDDLFWRSQTSGARATIRKKQGKTTANQDGDITATDPMGQCLISKVSIELKRGYPAFTIEGLINSSAKKPVLIDFYNQCLREVEGKEIDWLLIVKQDRKKTLAIFGDGFYFKYALKSQLRKKFNHLCLDYEKTKFYVFELEDFLNGINPEIFQ